MGATSDVACLEENVVKDVGDVEGLVGECDPQLGRCVVQAVWERRYETGESVPGGREAAVRGMARSPTRTWETLEARVRRGRPCWRWVGSRWFATW